MILSEYGLIQIIHIEQAVYMARKKSEYCHTQNNSVSEK